MQDLRKGWIIIQEDGLVFNGGSSDRTDKERNNFIKINLQQSGANTVVLKFDVVFREWTKSNFKITGTPNEAQQKRIDSIMEGK